jgi:hypothetical protein
MIDYATENNHPRTVREGDLKRLNNPDWCSSDLGPDHGARALLRAILQDAIICLTGTGVPKRDRRRIAEEAQRWIMSTSRRWLFDFESICDVLNIDPDYMRRRILRASCTSETGVATGGAAPEMPRGSRSLAHRVRQVRMRGNQRRGLLHRPAQRASG